jgi:cAMP-binding proteins - catabolite gene activator and regulatory subunit of cAMP-dependent protein kinases
MKSIILFLLKTQIKQNNLFEANMNNTEIQNFLKEVELFKDLSNEEIDLLHNAYEIVNYTPGEIIFEENQPRTSFYVIKEGSIQLYKLNPYGEERQLAVFGKNDFLAEGALLDDYPHSTSAKSLTNSVVFRFNAKNLQKVLEEKPNIYIKVISKTAQIISRRMRQTTNQVVDIATQYISGKTRQEHDLLGYKEVPQEVLYGIQTLRALENFEISKVSINHFPDLVIALAQIKLASAKAN